MPTELTYARAQFLYLNKRVEPTLFEAFQRREVAL